MSNWISSKLRVAETFLNQIDQQAAESLKKSENARSDGSDEPKLENPTKAQLSAAAVSLKDQLKKKPLENSIDYSGKLHSDHNVGVHCNEVSHQNSVSVVNVIGMPKSSPKTTLTDSDWTELLSTPNQGGSLSGTANAVPTVKVSGVRGMGKDGRRVQKGNGKNVVKNAIRSDAGKLNGKPSDGEDTRSSSSGRSSSVELQNDGKVLGQQDLDKGEQIDVNAGRLDSKKSSSKDFLRLAVENQPSEMVARKVDGVSHVKVRASGIRDKLKARLKGKNVSNANLGSSVSEGLKRGSSLSDGRSGSDSESGSTSDSESEREKEERRRRREKILAERAASRAVEAIKERENMVAKLEGEKQSLEKILEEQAKQQVQEASKLQTTMMQMMEAAELEKQKHNNTRMEALARLAKLETTTADLARSLASKQKNLEVEINRIAELRQQIEMKEVAHGELQRSISNARQTGKHLNQSSAAKGVEFEREILEAEYSLVTDKIVHLQDKVKKLEANIEMTRREIEDPTEVEFELKRRLSQLTDHLIQKQAQVEALSSEKATLTFRIETVTGLLNENKSSMSDLSSASSMTDVESGGLDLSNSKLRPMIEDKIRSGRKHLGSLILQLDSIFLAGVVFIKRNPPAKLWAVVYLVCLHLWVLYILMSHSQPSDGGSGALISLENLNRTGV